MAVASLSNQRNYEGGKDPRMRNVRTIYPWILQHLVPIPTSFSILNPQRKQLPKPRIGKYEFRPVLRQGRLRRGIRLLTNLQEGGTVGVVRRALLRMKCHTNVKNGGQEWIEGREKPVEVVCVDNAMAACGRTGSRDGSDLIGRLGARRSSSQNQVHTRLFAEERE